MTAKEWAVNIIVILGIVARYVFLISLPLVFDFDELHLILWFLLVLELIDTKRN